MSDLVIDAALGRSILTLELSDNDAGAKTVGEYLISLLHKLWGENEGFDSKRPFGDSGWEYYIYAALIEAKVVSGEIDEDGELADVDYETADQLVAAAIAAMMPPLITPAEHAGRPLIAAEVRQQIASDIEALLCNRLDHERTHSRNCWQWHPLCAIRFCADIARGGSHE